MGHNSKTPPHLRATVTGAKEYCTKRKLVKKCLYSAEPKFLVQTSDKVETGNSRTKTLEQELAASGLWDTDWSVGDILGLDDATEGAGENSSTNKKLVEYPDAEGSETLQEYLGQYKKAALNKKAVFKTTKERLIKDNASDYQCLDMQPCGIYPYKPKTPKISHIYIHIYTNTPKP